MTSDLDDANNGRCQSRVVKRTKYNGVVQHKAHNTRSKEAENKQWIPPAAVVDALQITFSPVNRLE